MRKKSPLKNSSRKLLKKAMQECERAFKAAVHRRDKICQLCNYRLMLQVDHWISRRNKSTYFSLNNLTLLCARCHTKKSFGYGDYAERVTDVVREREGEAVMKELRTLSTQIKKWTVEELNELTNAYNRMFV